MTDNTDDGDSNKKLITTRGVLKGIGGVGIGLGLGGAGVLAIADQSDHVNRAALIGPEKPDKTPPATEPGANSEDTDTARTSPWDKQELAVSLVRDESLGGYDEVPTRVNNAVEFWNDHIEANEQFDLTLSFEPNHSNPDIQIHEASMMQCFGEYDSPATNDEYLTPLVCVETLRETPNETPVTAELRSVVGGEALHELLAKHTIGRLLGFDIWTDPVEVMTPTILFGPAHADQPDARGILSKPGRAVPDLEALRDDAERSLKGLKNADDLPFELRDAEEEFADIVSEFETEMDQFTAEAERYGFPLYVEAYEKVIVNDELEYIDETRTMMTNLAENHTNEELKESDALDPLIERLEHIRTWAAEREMWDVQIHRHYGDAAWTKWASE